MDFLIDKECNYPNICYMIYNIRENLKKIKN